MRKALTARFSASAEGEFYRSLRVLPNWAGCGPRVGQQTELLARRKAGPIGIDPRRTGRIGKE